MEAVSAVWMWLVQYRGTRFSMEVLGAVWRWMQYRGGRCSMEVPMCSIEVLGAG